MELVWSWASSTKNKKILDIRNSVARKLQIWWFPQKFIEKWALRNVNWPNFITYFRNLDFKQSYKQLEENKVMLSIKPSIKKSQYHSNNKSAQHSLKLFVKIVVCCLFCSDRVEVVKFAGKSIPYWIFRNYELNYHSNEQEIIYL